MALIVLKFGGSSHSGTERLVAAAEKIAAARQAGIRTDGHSGTPIPIGKTRQNREANTLTVSRVPTRSGCSIAGETRGEKNLLDNLGSPCYDS